MSGSLAVLEASIRLLDFLWISFSLLAPMLLLGLFLAGVIHVLISRETVLRWLSGNNVQSVCASAAIGVPIPLCSCSVVPVVREMRMKGASRSSCMSFLMTAPETGADSILVTHAFFGFWAAVVRPLVSFLTAVIAGVICIGISRKEPAEPATEGEGNAAADCCDHDHGDRADHGRHRSLFADRDDCYVSPGQLCALLSRGVRDLARRGLAALGASEGARSHASEGVRDPSGTASQPATPDTECQSEQLTIGKVFRHVLRYGFVEVADDILFALLIGVGIGGLLFLAVPDGLAESQYARWISYPIMVLVGTPLYVCASASTPIAAALVAKGLSPGAAMVFLMTGPATNMGTIAIIVSQFGSLFARIYVGVVVGATVVLGILIDAILLAAGLTLPLRLSGPASATVQVVEWVGAVMLIALIVWRFRKGAWKSGYREFVSNLRPATRH